jgi:hypothetical protein
MRRVTRRPLRTEATSNQLAGSGTVLALAVTETSSSEKKPTSFRNANTRVVEEEEANGANEYPV